VLNIFNDLRRLGFTKIPEQGSIFTAKPEPEEQEPADQTKKSGDDAADFDIAQYVYLKKRLCPICSKAFFDVMMRSRKCRYLSSDSDLRARYTPLDPMYYDVVLCHFCGYAAMNSHFDNVTERQASLIYNAVKTQFEYKDYPLLFSSSDAFERYLLALLCATVKQARSSEKAMLSLRLAWLASDNKEPERELEFLSIALQGFEMAYGTEDFPMYGMESITLYYLMAELSRRLGNKEKAKRYIGRVLTSKETSDRLRDRALIVKELLK